MVRKWCHYLHTNVLNAVTKCNDMIIIHIQILAGIYVGKIILKLIQKS